MTHRIRTALQLPRNFLSESGSESLLSVAMRYSSGRTGGNINLAGSPAPTSTHPETCLKLGRALAAKCIEPGGDGPNVIDMAMHSPPSDNQSRS